MPTLPLRQKLLSETRTTQQVRNRQAIAAFPFTQVRDVASVIPFLEQRSWHPVPDQELKPVLEGPRAQVFAVQSLIVEEQYTWLSVMRSLHRFPHI